MGEAVQTPVLRDTVEPTAGVPEITGAVVKLGNPTGRAVLADHAYTAPLEFDPFTATVTYFPMSAAVRTYFEPPVRFVQPAGCERTGAASTEAHACH